MVVAVLGGALLLTKQRADRAADESVAKALDATQSAIEDALAGRSEALLKVTAGLAQVPTYVSRIDEALRSNNRSNLLDQADEFRDQVGAAWVLITDDRGLLKAWTYEPDLFDEDFSEGSLIGLGLEGELTEGTWIEPGAESDLIYQAVGVPIFDPRRTVVYGLVVAALPLDSLFASELKRRTNSDIVFFALDTLGVPYLAVSTVPRGDMDSALANLDTESVLTGDTTAARVRMPAAGETLVGVVGLLLTAAGFPLGGYVGFRSWGLELAAYTQLQQTILFAFAAGLLLALMSSLLLARQITRPVKRLVEATRRVSEGHYSGTIDVRSRDEIGELASAFQRMVRELKEKEKLVEYLRGSGRQADRHGTITPSDAKHQLEARVPGVISVGSMLSGRYEIKEMIGAGGMGDVYRAYDRELDETVAIKTLKREAVQADTTVLERFKQEIRLARRITHRNVVRTYDLGEVNGTYYITMEFVEGTTLKNLIGKRGQLPVGVAITIGKQLCRALEVAHEQGVIHRDIKPQNLIVDQSGFLKVTDFGIARLAERSRELGEGLTAAGATMGTPEYMAPEQLLGEEIDERADLYAAGAVLFECVTGRPVFSAPTVPALVVKHLREELEDPRSLNPRVPASLAELILKALAEQPEDRWQSARELSQALDGVGLEAEVE